MGSEWTKQLDAPPEVPAAPPAAPPRVSVPEPSEALAILVPGLAGQPDATVTVTAVLPGIEGVVGLGAKLFALTGRVPWAALNPHTQAIAHAAAFVHLCVPNLPGDLAARLDVDHVLLVRLSAQLQAWAAEKAGGPATEVSAEPAASAAPPATTPAFRREQTPESIAAATDMLRRLQTPKRGLGAPPTPPPPAQPAPPAPPQE